MFLGLYLLDLPLAHFHDCVPLYSNHTVCLTVAFMFPHTALPVDPCTVPMICKNGGTCQSLPGDFNYSCDCVPGFSGRNCGEGK